MLAYLVICIIVIVNVTLNVYITWLKIEEYTLAMVHKRGSL